MSTQGIELQERLNAMAIELHARQGGDLVAWLETCARELAPGRDWRIDVACGADGRPRVTLLVG